MPSITGIIVLMYVFGLADSLQGGVFAVIILVCVIVAVVTGDVAYFVNQQALGKNTDEEE